MKKKFDHSSAIKIKTVQGARFQNTEKPIIVPRSAGLSMAQIKNVDDVDRAMVEEAEIYLIQLLQDPYYYEALQRLIRRRHPNVSRTGLLPYKKGSLAKKYQEGGSHVNTESKGRGRPRKERPGIKNLLGAIESHNKRTGVNRSLMDWSRRLMKGGNPNATIVQIESLALELANELRQERKRQNYRGRK